MISSETIDTPAGPVVLRPEREEDRDFRFTLFCASRPPEWAAVTLAPDVLDKVMRLQFRAQTVGYAGQFPRARFDIVERDRVPIGRIVVDREPGAIHIVDQAIVPSWRGCGIGAAIMRSIMAEAAGRGVPVNLEVGDSNDPSLRLYLRLGFTVVEELPMYLNLRWTPPCDTAAGAA